ncbi:MAG: hypothetical protein AAFO69_04285 [Bacteroidota bacterium]
MPEDPITRSEEISQSVYTAAMQLYSKGKYTQSLELLTSIKDDEHYAGRDLYVGNCLLSLDKSVEAIPHFQDAVNSSNQQIRGHAKWYLALAYLNVDKSDKASALLQELANSPGHMYQEKSLTLLDKMKWIDYHFW